MGVAKLIKNGIGVGYFQESDISWSRILHMIRLVLLWGHLHFTGTELNRHILIMGVASGHSNGHVTLV